MYKKFSRQLSYPITDVFNTILKETKWPEEWRREYITVIPKVQSPEDFDQLRNIACTNFLSKVLERFVLSWSREEITPKRNQFGGEKGCGPAHLLIETTNYITESLEDNRAAVVATSMDYSKAFNRLNHQSCIESFIRKGASTKIVRILSSFLMGRTMSVRLGSIRSHPRNVTTGAPQGSVLGAYLFNVGIDTIEDGCQYPGTRLDTVEHLVHRSDCPAVSTPLRVTTTRRSPSLSPIREDGQEIDLLPRTANAPPWLRRPKDPKWVDKPPMNAKFIDDGIHLAKINMRLERLLYEHGKPIKCVHDSASQAMFNHIVKEASTRGMLVNAKKTALMVFSAATSFEARAILEDDQGNKIHSTDSLKMLGYTYDKEAGPSLHVKIIAQKMRSRSWALAKLKRAEFTNEELIKTYKVYMRPLVEYLSVLWHPMLSAEQSATLEQQQTQALRHIYGYGPSAAKMRSWAGIDLLSKRRETACVKFAKKTVRNPRFQWFKERAPSVYERRNMRYNKYEEKLCRTDRHKHSPIQYLTRLLNKE